MLTSRNFDAQVGCINGQDVEEQTHTNRFQIIPLDETDLNAGSFIEADFNDEGAVFVGDRFLSSMYGNVKALISEEEIDEMRNLVSENRDLSSLWHIQCNDDLFVY